MPIHQEVSFTAAPERVYQALAVEHRIRNCNPVRDQEQTADDLRVAVESLQQIVCELLLRNQILRIALDRDREFVTSSSATGFPTGLAGIPGDVIKNQPNKCPLQGSSPVI
jgi:hypothetical protein